MPQLLLGYGLTFSSLEKEFSPQHRTLYDLQENCVILSSPGSVQLSPGSILSVRSVLKTRESMLNVQMGMVG